MKKIPLRFIFTTLMAVIICAVGVIILTKVVTNHSFVKDYNNGIYQEDREKTLLVLNAPESYLPFYNLGNVAYKRGDYPSAIGYYNKALSLFPTGRKDCRIRINLALAMCYSIDYAGINSQEKIDTALFTLYKARDILLENGCAKDGEEVGHDRDAQQLKEDIDRLIEELQNLKEQENNNSGEDEQQPQQGQSDKNDSADNTPSDKENRMKDKLERDKKNALEDRKETQDNLEKWSKYFGEGDEDVGSGDGGDDAGYTRPW